MPREHAPSRSLLATHRHGRAVAVDAAVALASDPAALGIPRKRPVGYLLHARGVTGEIVTGAARAVPGPGVAVIQIRGIITQHEEYSSCGEAANFDEITSRVCDAHGDPGVGALVIDCETNGGDLDGGEEAIETMVAAAASSGKPVLGYVGSRCFSMGMWLLSGLCNAGIVCYRAARLGSIGVVADFETDARHAADDGYDRTVFRYPPGKANPNPLEALDPIGTARLQELVTTSGERFVAHVAATRGIDPAAILAWNGGTFVGPAAVAAKLADSVGTLETTIALAASYAGYQEAA